MERPVDKRDGNCGRETCHVLVLDAGGTIRRLMGYLEADDGRFELVAFVDSEAAMRRLVEQTRPDEVLAAIDAGDRAVEAVIRVARDHRAMRVVVQTPACAPAETVRRLRRAGVVVVDGAHPAELDDALVPNP